MKWYANDKRDIDIQRMLREKSIIKKDTIIVSAVRDQRVDYTEEHTGRRVKALVALVITVMDSGNEFYQVCIDSKIDRDILMSELNVDTIEELIGRFIEIYLFDDKIMRGSSIVITVSVKG